MTSAGQQAPTDEDFEEMKRIISEPWTEPGEVLRAPKPKDDQETTDMKQHPISITDLPNFKEIREASNDLVQAYNEKPYDELWNKLSKLDALLGGPGYYAYLDTKTPKPGEERPAPEDETEGPDEEIELEIDDQEITRTWKTELDIRGKPFRCQPLSGDDLPFQDNEAGWTGEVSITKFAVGEPTILTNQNEVARHLGTRSADQIIEDHEKRDDGGRALIWSKLSDEEKDHLHCAGLNEKDFCGADLRGAKIYSASFCGCYFDEAAMSEVDFRGSVFDNCNFRQANMRAANFRDASLSEATLTEVYALDANFSGAEMEGAYLNKAFLENANLSDANLENAVLADAILTGANLRGANLRNANLSCVKFDGAELAGADLTGAKLEGCNLSEEQTASVRAGREVFDLDVIKPKENPSDVDTSLIETIEFFRPQAHENYASCVIRLKSGFMVTGVCWASDGSANDRDEAESRAKANAMEELERLEEYRRMHDEAFSF